ncbi:MAG TPA: ComF family protein [bacterium]|nr:ComF family protein [bacterium]
MPVFSRLLRAPLAMLFPPRCEACGDFIRPGDSLCGVCEARWPALGSPSCPVCAEPFAAGPDHRCGRCITDAPAFDRLRASGRYEGLLLELVVRLKYRGEEKLAGLLGDRMAGSTAFGGVDLLLPIPLHAGRLRERGFNQAVLLARRLSRRTGLPMNPFLLRKVRPTPAQATLSVEERRKNLRGVFQLKEPGRVAGLHVMLVDDVATSGATLHEAARALKQAGAERVEAVVAARAL